MGRRRGAAAEEPAFERVADLAPLEALAAEWDALLERSSCNRAFGSPRWYLTGCRLEPAWRPYAVIARRGGKLAGVLALVRPVEGGAASFPGELSDSNDAVVARGDLAVSAGLLRAALAGGAPLDLQPVRADSNLALGLRALAPSRDPDRSLSAEGRLRCSFADLSGGYDAYLATRTSKFRNNLRRARRRAAERGLRVGELQPGSFAPSELPGAFLELHGRRFPESCFASPRERAFAEQALPVLFADRALRAFAVFDGGRMIAISLCAVGDRSFGGCSASRFSALRWARLSALRRFSLFVVTTPRRPRCSEAVPEAAASNFIGKETNHGSRTAQYLDQRRGGRVRHVAR